MKYYYQNKKYYYIEYSLNPVTILKSPYFHDKVDCLIFAKKNNIYAYSLIVIEKLNGEYIKTLIHHEIGCL